MVHAHRIHHTCNFLSFNENTDFLILSLNENTAINDEHNFFKQAKPETLNKVCEIVRNQLALAPDTVVNGESKFVALGADSLDTVLQCLHLYFELVSSHNTMQVIFYNCLSYVIDLHSSACFVFFFTF